MTLSGTPSQSKSPIPISTAAKAFLTVQMLLELIPPIPNAYNRVAKLTVEVRSVLKLALVGRLVKAPCAMRSILERPIPLTGLPLKVPPAAIR